MKRVDPYYRSEEVPDNTDKKIRKLVGKNFHDEVFREPYSYLVLFWDSKDRESAEPHYNLLKEFI